MINSTDQIKAGRGHVDLSQRLSMWVIYKSPSDYPGKFVARLWIMERYASSFAPTTQRQVADSLAELRDEVRIGRSRLERQPADDPVIVECWI